MAKRILRRPEVEHLTGLSRSTIYLRIAAGKFPKPIKLGEHARGWDSDAIDDWIEQRIKESRNGEAA